MQPAARAALVRMAVDAGRSLHDERIRRGWTLRELAERAGTAVAVAHRVEAGDVATLESYARLAVALGLRPEVALADPRTRRTTGPTTYAASDFVHAAMGEVEARALARPWRTIAIDEPYQHYQFAGRADVLAWDDCEPAPHREPHPLPATSRRPPAPGTRSANTSRVRSPIAQVSGRAGGEASRMSWPASGHRRCSTRSASAGHRSRRCARTTPTRSRPGSEAINRDLARPAHSSSSTPRFRSAPVDARSQPPPNRRPSSHATGAMPMPQTRSPGNSDAQRGWVTNTPQPR